MRQFRAQGQFAIMAARRSAKLIAGWGRWRVWGQKASRFQIQGSRQKSGFSKNPTAVCQAVAWIAPQPTSLKFVVNPPVATLAGANRALQIGFPGEGVRITPNREEGRRVRADARHQAELGMLLQHD